MRQIPGAFRYTKVTSVSVVARNEDVGEYRGLPLMTAREIDSGLLSAFAAQLEARIEDKESE